MRGCVLDSDVIIQLLRNDARAVHHISAIPAAARATTIINCSELLYGAYNSTAIEKNLATAHAALRQLNILPLTYACCERYGLLKATLRHKGATVGDKDLLIAAIALHHNVPVFTYNTRDFSRIPDLALHVP